MDRVWITNGSTSVAPIVNPLNAACHDGFVPTDIYVLSNPGIDDVTERAASMMKTVVTANGGPEPTVERRAIDDELAFEAIVEYLQDAIEAAEAPETEVAIDVTPGRKFWSIISFRAGQTYEVEHLYYSHILTRAYYATPYPTIPRTAMNLIDFTEVLG
jgi:hypothetical protein